MKLSKSQYTVLMAAAQRLTVPYHQLILSKTYQARTSTHQLSLEELAASIQTVGLLHNLIVVQRPRNRFEVCGGGRRWRAIGLLVARDELPENYPVSVLVVPSELGLMASLAENCHHEPMHPADEFVAFAQLIDNGRSVEDVAAAFGVTPLVVTRRMKLARVSPVLMAQFRADEIGLDCLMALASVDDHARQEQAWQAMPQWDRRPERLRAWLVQDEVASSHPLVEFVGVSAYEAAGGQVRRDLFSDQSLMYLLDRLLLESLALERVEAVAAAVREEGWHWVEARLRFDYGEFGCCHSLRPTERQPDELERTHLTELEIAIDTLRAQVESAEDDDSTSLSDQLDSLETQLQVAERALHVWEPEALEQAGCVVFINQDGEPEVRRGLIRPEDAASRGQPTEAPSQNMPPEIARPVHSKDLMRRLTAHRVAALQAELLEQPAIALAALTTQLARCVLATGVYRRDSVLSISAIDTRPELLDALGDLGTSAALQRVDTAAQEWRECLPADSEDWFSWLLEQDHSQVMRLLVFSVARTLTGIYSTEPSAQCTDVLAQAIGLDMRPWWRVTAETYFKHVSKQRIVEVVGEAVNPASAAPLEGMKKELCALRAEQLMTDTGWLPPCLRGPSTDLDTAAA